MKDLFVCDLDDTLIDNTHDYAGPILDACRLIIDTLGNRAPHVSRIVQIEEEIDARRVKEINPATGSPYLYCMERFPGSLVETYREICRKSGEPAHRNIEEELYRIGMEAFDARRYVKNVHPAAARVIRFLKWHGNRLVLCTKGDKRVQDKKIKALRDAEVPVDLFDDIVIVATKDEALFRSLRTASNAPRSYSMGNSYQSDIVPAIAAGFYGIYIPVETWETVGKMDSILSEIDSARPSQCIVLPNLNAVMEWYEEVECAN